MTEYVILERSPEVPAAVLGPLQLVASTFAWSPTAAIRAYAREFGAEDGSVFVAIPARAWKPMRVSVTSEVRVTVELEA